MKLMIDLGATTEGATKLIYVSHLVYLFTRQAGTHSNNRHEILGV
jgi:hypothetical protein